MKPSRLIPFLHSLFTPRRFTGWSAPVYQLENGDIITKVNGRSIKDWEHFRKTVQSSRSDVTITVIDHRTGRGMRVRTQLDSQDVPGRLGINGVNSQVGGVVITGTADGSPAQRFRLYRK